MLIRTRAARRRRWSLWFLVEAFAYALRALARAERFVVEPATRFERVVLALLALACLGALVLLASSCTPSVNVKPAQELRVVHIHVLPTCTFTPEGGGFVMRCAAEESEVER